MAAAAPFATAVAAPFLSAAVAAPVPSSAVLTVDYSRLKLLCILMGPGAAVLSHALKCGTNKSPSVTLLDHLASLPDSSTANYHRLNGERKRKAFNSDEKRTIGNDPSCQTFDITLLYKSITLACERVAPLNDDTRWKDPAFMEGLLNKIKGERNACVHEWSQTIMDEDQFKNKLQELEKLFIRALQAVRDRYGVSAAETKTIIDIVRGQIEDVSQAFTDKVILIMNFEKRLDVFKELSACHLKDLYKHFECFDPLSFLCGSKERVHIQRVFSKLVLQHQHTPAEIDALELLKVLTDECRPSPPVQDDRPRLAVVRGIAGSGKTTLLTFMVSEWRREECDRRVKHLEEYDIVLRILCRDTDAENLETFLGLVLPPSLSVFGEPLVNYLERCKVLFLIDGLDEMNQTSEKLVTNVMTLARCNKQFSIIVTSRPERVDRFLSRYEQDYRLSQLSIEGIPVARRTEFALQYSTSSTNQDKLREFMTKQKDIKLFELPLNLLFLVRVFEDKPDCIKENTTQASLYTHFHDWCTEKLRVRISTHPTSGERSPLTLKTRIKRVLQEMYQMVLQGLLQDRLSLSEEDTERLVHCCEREDLPAQEVLGAFFSLRLSVNNRVREERYSLPHKGLLEYFAARHIMQHLQDGYLSPSGAVRSLFYTVTQQGTFHGLRNLLFQVAGLLAREEMPNRPEAIKEVVELVAETGAGWDGWLSLAEHTDYDESFLQAIAHHVTENPPGDTVWIRDNTLASAAALLPRTPPPTTVRLWLDNESVNVENVRALTHHHCSQLRLHHHYQQPGNTPASDTVLHAIHRSRLKWFVGHLSADCLALLPECLVELSLAVSSDENAAHLTAALTRAASSLPNLFDLTIHVPMSMVTTAALLSPLPDIRNVFLALSGVDKSLVKEACQVAAALQPGRGYWDIGFPRASMEAAEWRRLLQLLKAAQVRVGRRGREWWRGGVVIPEETITVEERKELTHLADTLWGCKVYRVSNEECFQPYLPYGDESDEESDGKDDGKEKEAEKEEERD